MHMRQYFILLIIISLPFFSAAQKRAIVPSDVYRLQDVGSAQVSPDGKWVAYVVTSVDSAKDEHDDNIWMISWDGSQNIQLTYSNEDESSPKWSPDGKYLSFLSSRKLGDDDCDDDDKDLSQLWLLDRRGGEAKKITNVTGDIEDYAWSPDGNKIVFEIKDQD